MENRVIRILDILGQDEGSRVGEEQREPAAKANLENWGKGDMDGGGFFHGSIGWMAVWQKHPGQWCLDLACHLGQGH